VAKVTHSYGLSRPVDIHAPMSERLSRSIPREDTRDQRKPRRSGSAGRVVSHELECVGSNPDVPAGTLRCKLAAHRLSMFVLYAESIRIAVEVEVCRLISGGPSGKGEEVVGDIVCWVDDW
jgi:hypothetical protein